MIHLDAHQLLDAGRDWNDLFDHLASVRARISLVVTGGGSGSIAQCLRRPGASQFFVEAIVPYSRRAARAFLQGELPTPNVCEKTAIELAREAYRRAGRLADDDRGSPAGIALTAALPTKPPRDHVEAIFVGLVTESKTETWCVPLPPGRFDRQTAEDIADAMILVALYSL